MAVKRRKAGAGPVAVPAEMRAASPAAPPEVLAFPIVGVGASAGGLEAFTQMLRALPVDTGMAFILVQHLAPTHASMLAEILARTTAMRVAEIAAGEPRVEPDHVYVIPSNCDLIIQQGRLRLLPRGDAHGQHRPIDRFFRSLAEDQGHRAIGVILSGTATDGTLGLAAIKAAGGITFAQDDSALQSGMPQSAVAGGCVDFVLPPAAIAQEIARIARHPHVAPAPAGRPEAPDGLDLANVLRLLHDAFGVDFNQYKVNTLSRRITRRMALHRLRDLPDYERFLHGDPGEVEALYQDLLIGVTSFFRDPGVFTALQATILPRLLADVPRREPLRVWTPGCSSGEETYSLAIALAEFAADHGRALPVQIFATDLNGAAIERARAAAYPRTIAQDVSPERLRRFFVEVDDHYCVAKPIRDMCIFARHDLLVDPPFSRIDLITCRNLLIYLEPATQQRIAPLLHYALKPTGFLVLGSSETVGSYRDLFAVADVAHKIFARRPGTGRFAFGPAAGRLPGLPRGADRGPGLPADAAGGAEVQKEADRILLARYAPPGVVVTADLEILQFRGDTGPYLAPAPGKASLNLLKMAREGLLVPLRAAVARAAKEQAAVRAEGLRVKSDGGIRALHLEVIPVDGSAARGGGFLVLFEDASPPAALPRGRRGGGEALHAGPERLREEDTAERRNARLAQELAATREYLQSMIEQQEAANEELQSANEEVQSANEELQSLNEELETSKEEIQSANEELVTLNDELQNRNLELSQSTSDMVNLLDSVQVPIVMLGQDGRVRRFTPAAEKVLGLSAADLGRPLCDVRLAIDLPGLEALLAEVIATAATEEREVQDARGCWHLLRLRPYRTLDGRIDGAVMVLVDVNTLKRAERFAQNVVATVRESLLVLDADLRVRTASRSFYQTFALTPETTEGRPLYELADGEWNIPELRRLLDEILPQDNSLDGFEVRHLGGKTLLLNARRLVHEDGDAPLILLAIEDVTERQRLEEALHARVEELATADRSKDEFLALLAHELRNPLAPLSNALHLLEAPLVDGAAGERARAIMGRQIQNMSRLIEDLLEVSRITRGKVLLQRGPVELATLVQRAVEVTQHSIDGRGQELSLSLPSEPVYLDADATRLEQVFGNLLHNASKFTPQGGHLELTAELASDGLSPPGEIVVRVRDDGMGIAPAMLPRVFDLFTQADRSLDRSQGGLGIGLTLVRSLVELHGGRVEARSAGLDQGSEIVVHLPVSAAAPRRGDGAEDSDAGRAAPTVAPRPRRILVVDDNLDTAESLSLLLRMRGHEVGVAHSGPAALEAALAFAPEVVLLDIGLPGLDGYQVARELRRNPRLANALLVALTGYGQDEDRLLAQEAGFDHHLTKPVDLKVLYGLVDLAGPRN